MMASAMIEASRRAEHSDDELISDGNDIDEFEEESSISSLNESDDEPKQPEAKGRGKAKKASKENGVVSKSKTPISGGVFHMRPLPGVKPFTCEICSNVFQQKKSLYRHIKEVHKLKLVFVDGDGKEDSVRSKAASGKSKEQVNGGKRRATSTEPSAPPAKKAKTSKASKENGKAVDSKSKYYLRSLRCEYKLTVCFKL